MNAKNQMLDVVVIGAGQAGLASGWHLKQHGLNFRIFDEQPQPGGNWRNYYDKFRKGQLFIGLTPSVFP